MYFPDYPKSRQPQRKYLLNVVNTVSKGSVIKASKGTHVTKDGRVAKKGLYYYMNRRKKAGTSRPGKGTVSSKALKRSARTAKR